MSHLSLCLLGSFRLKVVGQPVTDFKSNKVRALLAFLAVEVDRPHRRETLAGMLWPEYPDRNALSNLRYALSNLRQVIGDRQAEPPFLLITRDTLQFNSTSDYWLDVTAFTEMFEVDLTHPAAIEQLETAVGLYKGSFLEGFSITDSPAFEEWTLITRERLTRHLASALHLLAEICEQRCQYEQAQSYARRQIELEPWDEEAHRQLMRSLALDGQRGVALAQYETCCRLLSEDLGVEPAQETTRLYEQIRSGELLPGGLAPPVVPEISAVLPPIFDEELSHIEIPSFFARKRELVILNKFLKLALNRQGRVAFVTGEAGSGKTALIQEFSRQAQKDHDDLIVAWGNCNAYTGIGDPYLPFREILELLTGDIKAGWMAGAIGKEYAHHLWQILPLMLQALVDVGPELVDTFVHRKALLGRLGDFTDWPGKTGLLARLDDFSDYRFQVGTGGQSPQQSDLFEQYTRVLQSLTKRGPLLLVVDDLQWADLGSISLLFHLSRNLAGNRILIVGAFRPEEVALERDGERHPLEPVVNEFQREFGDIIVSLDQAGNQDFVDALLDSEANRLGRAFREMLYQQTRGHPLFTIELLRGLQERGDLVQNGEGYWVEGPNLNWEMLPARVEAVIAERIGRLDQSLQTILRVASVEGEIFTAEVVALVLGTNRREMVNRLSGELDQKHRLVQAQIIERLETRRVSRYRFKNYLFQKYLYETLDEVERAYLHEDVGNVLEEIYGSRANEFAVQLAWHFQEAGIVKKAIHYLHQAGDKAAQLSAYREAVAHLDKGLALLMTLPESPERDRQELALQLSLSLAWISDIPNPEWGIVISRARELCQKTGKTTQLSRVLGEMSIFHYVRAEYEKARELGEEALNLAKKADDPLLKVLTHWQLGFISFGLGKYTTARAHLNQVITFYNPQQHHQPFILLRGSDPGVSALAYDACCLWCLGYPEQALKRREEALTMARELDHSFSLADVICFAGCLYDSMQRNAAALKDDAEELMQLAREIGFPTWSGISACYLGEALAGLGHLEKGISKMREGIAARQSRGSRCYEPVTLSALAETQLKAGKLADVKRTLDGAFLFVEQSGERQFEAELYRIKGQMFLVQGDEAKAESNLLRAIEVAQRQQTKSWELRAAIALSRLWQRQGKRQEAHHLLAGVYNWFSEGLETADLLEARILLEELSS